MKAHYRSKNGQFTVEVDGGNIKEVIENVAIVQEVLEAETSCGLCSKNNLRYQVREVDGNKFYELVCIDCGARVEFGQHKKTPTLFPKRKDGVTVLPHRGWAKWEGKNGKAA